MGAKRWGDDTIKKFFERINSRDDFEDIYKHMLHHLITNIKKDGVTFLLSADGKKKTYITDVRDRLSILHGLKKHFLKVELYEVLSDIDTMIKTHQEVVDDMNSVD